MKKSEPISNLEIEQIRSLEASVDLFDTEIDRLLSGFDTQLTTITGIDPTSTVKKVKRLRWYSIRPSFCILDSSAHMAARCTPR